MTFLQWVGGCDQCTVETLLRGRGVNGVVCQREEEVNRMLQIDTLAEDVVPTASIVKGS
jgi:hypothetical protein